MEIFKGSCILDSPNDRWDKLSKQYVSDIMVDKKKIRIGKYHPSGVEYKIWGEESILGKFGEHHVQMGKDGRTVEGQISCGQIYKGTIKYLNGNLYEGQIVKKRAHGIGTMIYKNDDKYTGRFSYDLRNGVGELVCGNGMYKGSFKNDEIHGKGIFQYDDGSIYSGKGIFLFENQKK